MKTAPSVLLSALVAVGAGASFITQSALNSQLAVVLRSPIRAGLISYAGGTLVMVFIALVQRGSWAYIRDFAPQQWLLWTGGIFGSIYVLAAIVLLPRLGAATMFALLVTGQLLGSLVFDQLGLFGLPQRSIDLPRVAGVACMIAGVVLIRRP